MARLALKPGNILLLSKVLSLRDSAFTPVSNTHVCVWGGAYSYHSPSVDSQSATHSSRAAQLLGISLE